MALFKVSAVVTVSCYTEVEAATKEEAREVAGGRSLAEFTPDGGYPIDEYWHMEPDGEPDITAIDRAAQ